MSDLERLIARCEKASGADRELDARIWWELYRDVAERVYWNATLGLPRKIGAEFPAKGLGYVSLMNSAPAFTKSLDVAMTLVPSDCEWEIGSAHLLGVYWARLISAAEVYTAKRAPTPALALVISAVKARQLKE